MVHFSETIITEQDKKMQAQHEAVKKVSWLIGKWIGRNGKGVYPTIKSFEYKESLEVLHPEPAQPVLHLK